MPKQSHISTQEGTKLPKKTIGTNPTKAKPHLSHLQSLEEATLQKSNHRR